MIIFVLFLHLESFLLSLSRLFVGLLYFLVSEEVCILWKKRQLLRTRASWLPPPRPPRHWNQNSLRVYCYCNREGKCLWSKMVEVRTESKTTALSLGKWWLPTSKGDPRFSSSLGTSVPWRQQVIGGHDWRSIRAWLKVHQGMINQEENWDQGIWKTQVIKLYGIHFKGQHVRVWLTNPHRFEGTLFVFHSAQGSWDLWVTPGPT